MHFSNAARLLGISQPALTKAISQLENELGTRLIRREGKHTQLTEHGESVRAKYAELTYRALDIAGDVRNIVRGGDEKICIGVTPFVDFAPFAEFLVTFHQKCPHAFIDVIECSEHDSEQKLLHGEVDCVLTVQKDTINGRVSHFEIYETCLEMVGKSSISAHNVVSMQQVASMQQNEAEVGKQLSKSQSQLVWQQKHGEYVQIAVCSQQIWAQQLLKSGFGDAINLCGHSCRSKRQQIIHSLR